MSETQPASILVVDDEAPIMKALCDTLQQRGFRTVGCTSSKAALEELKKQRFELLLADLMIPDLDGISLLRVAQEIDPYLVGIIMTGQGAVDTAVEAMKSGALDYVQKPFKLSTILPVVGRALNVRRLRVQNEALEHRVRLRTDELEAANRELESFSYSVSHDLRAPLRALTSFSGILLDEYASDLPQEARELVERIGRNATRMNQLVDDLLRFSRLSQQPLARKQVDVRNLVIEVLQEMRKKDGDRAVDVRVGDLPESYCDPALIRQVFANLLENAFKFTRHREETVIEVDSERVGDDIAYYVRDNGAGFEMRHSGKLFGVFQRLHSTSEFEGTGIGLSIVQRIINRHGGRIWAEAAVDQGATFYFTIPDER